MSEAKSTLAVRNALSSPERRALNKRAGDDHDHDHDHPTTTTSAGPAATSTAPAHDHGHDHGHDHETTPGADGHLDSDNSEADSGHSHGPDRVCDQHDHQEGTWVLWHHLVSLFVLIVVATLGCALPMIIRESRRTRFMIQCGKYFGAGVVLSVAFIHIMPEALFSLTHPCLSKAWTDDYPGYSPLIMMVSGLTMLVIEFLASSLALKLQAQSKAAAAAAGSPGALEAQGHHHDEKHEKEIEHGHSAQSSSDEANHKLDDDCGHAHGLILECGPGVSTKVSTYMLEIGIALHSVFIGIALGTLAGSEFVAMTIAICFHQFFEGLALGSRIAELTFEKKLVPIMLVVAFALVTPLGMAIGMGIQSTYKQNSVENLITMGVFDSIACGVLLYTAYVTLLGGDILFSDRFRAEAKANKASYLISVWLGAIAMAVLALWA
ncbi:high-affinity Zn(2+) transporter zrt1 [Mortierella sp. GBA43]|nr:high-affinity Zn(2+) transporter zrt1 [Mortierella sp. GBA43]